MDVRLAHIGGPTVLIEVAGWRLLTDRTRGRGISRTQIVRRWPPALWLLVFVGSVFVLMGTRMFDAPIAGVAVIVIACAIAVWLATRPEPASPRPRGVYATLGGVAAFYVVAAVAAGAESIGYAVVVLVAGAIPMTAVALTVATTRRKTRALPEDLRDEAVHDRSPFPGMGMDAARPLGDSPELHDEISAHDLPKSHPGRIAAETQAGGWGGTTRGHRWGGAATAPGSERVTDTSRVGPDEADGARMRPGDESPRGSDEHDGGRDADRQP